MKQLKKTLLILFLAMGMTLGMIPLAAAPVHATGPNDAATEDTSEAFDETAADETPETPDAMFNINEVKTYDLWIKGTQVTDENAGNVLGDMKVSYDAGTKTLTLNDAAIDADYVAIQSNSDLNIELKGDNTVSSSNYQSAIKVENRGSLTVTGDGTLKVSAGQYAMYAEGNITVDSGEVTVAGSGYNNYAVYALGDINIKGGKLDQKGNGQASIWASNVNISGGTVNADMTAVNVYAIGAQNNVNISGGTVTAKTYGNSAYSIRASNVAVSGGKVKAAADGQSSYGIRAGSITIEEDAELEASGYTAAISGTVTNKIDGSGWSDYRGSGEKKYIPVNESGGSLSYGKVKFPGDVARRITVQYNSRVQTMVDKNMAYAGETVTVKVWPQGAYSPKVIIRKTTNDAYVQEVELTAIKQGFQGSFTMPNYDVTVTVKAQGAGDGGSDENGTADGSGDGKSASSSKSPDTDDHQNMGGWAAVMIASASALAALVIKRKGILHR